MSEFNYVAAATAVTVHERKSARLEGTYDALAQFLNLTPDTDSADVTAAARRIVVTGAGHDGTRHGAALTEDDLTGRDPGNGSPFRNYWKAARAVRIGLVSAIKRASGESDEQESTTDYLARIVKAVEAGVKHDLSSDAIMAAVKAHLS